MLLVLCDGMQLSLGRCRRSVAGKAKENRDEVGLLANLIGVGTAVLSTIHMFSSFCRSVSRA